MPTINQLVRQGRETDQIKSKSPAPVAMTIAAAAERYLTEPIRVQTAMTGDKSREDFSISVTGVRRASRSLWAF